MFRLFSFRQLAIVSVFLCSIMLLGTCLNAVAPYVETMSQKHVNLPIIMYHQVHGNSKLWGDYVISVARLKDDFEYMKRNNINPVSFEMLRKFVDEGASLPDNPVVITFDDGERSFLTKVVPLLEEYGFPANINVIGSLVVMYTENGETNDSYAYLSENDIKLLCENSLVELGCHTYNLHSLGSRRGMAQLYGESDEEYIKIINEDTDKFNQLFFDLTGEYPVIFAYPYGIKNSRCEQALKSKGFTVTLTCREAVNKITQGSSLLNLGRFNRPYSYTTKEFFDKILKNT